MSNGTRGSEGDGEQRAKARVQVNLEAWPERKLIETGGAMRFVDFRLQVSQAPADSDSSRTPLTLALVLDRSGSMRGDKLRMARHAALAVLDQLDERDRVAIVVFDDQIDTVQPLMQLTSDIKAHARAALARIDARANTALHEGWLTGCNAIAEESTHAAERGLARCFLLTDGLANVGVTDPEQISSQAGSIRHKAGIGTSTFGIGDDYNEMLLAQMAAAGGGEFYHLRSADEIARTFIGELGEVLGAAAGNARLEIETRPGVNVETISAYRFLPADGSRFTLPIGDLLSGEERHIIVRFGFPAGDGQEAQRVRARLVWTADGAEQRTSWQELAFRYAGDETAQAEKQDADVMRWVWRDQADAAQREAIEQSRRGDWRSAQATVQAVSGTIREHAADDDELQARLAELQDLDRMLTRGPLSAPHAKEAYYRSQSRSHGKGGRDFRKPPEP